MGMQEGNAAGFVQRSWQEWHKKSADFWDFQVSQALTIK